MSAPTDYEIARAQRHARATAALRRPVTACPFDPSGSDSDRVLAMRWVCAYLDARPPGRAVDYADDTSGGDQ